MSSIVELKRTLRQQLRATVAAMSSAERSMQSCRLVDLIDGQPRWRAAVTVMLFVPLKDEPNLLPLLNAAIKRGKTVLLPRFVSDEAGYEAAHVVNLGTDLTTGRFGVAEPANHCAVLPLKSLDVCLVPGLGFDCNGRRLGRGKGFYDRLLAGLPGGLWGVGFDGQLLPELPVEKHDVVLNCIATPSRWVEVVPRGAE